MSKSIDPTLQFSIPIPRIFPGLFALALCLAGVGVASAQETAAMSDVDTDEEATVTLSPFEVSAASDQGYLATQTLSGGRTKTNLADLANQVEVFTPQFLDDWDLKTVDQALTYSTNVEGSEEFTDANNARYSTGTSTFGRIRGLGSGTSATGSRNFFVTNNRMDGYNIQRVEIASGPNAILFGLGNPGGIISTQIKQARVTGRDRGNLELRLDSEGSFSANLDYNKILLKKVLALRLAATHQDLETSRKPNYYQDDRLYLTGTLRPFGGTEHDNTAIRLHYEKIDIDNSRAPNKIVFDEASPFFINGGAQTFDNRGHLNGRGNRTVFDNPLPDYLTDDRNGNTFYFAPEGNAGSDVAFTGTYGETVVLVPTAVPSNGVSALDNFRWSLPVSGPYGDIYPVDLNWEGETYLQRHDSEVLTAFLEQRITDNLYMEIGYNRETVERRSVGLFRGGDFRLYVDANEYLPISLGQEPNPNAGRLYLEGIPNGSMDDLVESEFRASLAYEWDVARLSDAKWANWLGTHNFGLLYQDRESRSEAEDYFAKVIDPEASFLPATSRESGGRANWGVGAGRVFFVRRYLTDADPVATSVGDFWHPVEFQHSATGETFHVGVFDSYGPQREPIGRYYGVESLSFNWMGHLLDDSLILSYGVRKDDVQKREYTTENGTKGPEGAWLPYSEREFGGWMKDEKGTTRAKGVVFKPLALFDRGDRLSLYWYESDNFNPGQGLLNPLTHEPVPGNLGEGIEYGLRLSLFENSERSLAFTWNWFETDDKAAEVSNVFGATRNNFIQFDRAVARTYNEAAGSDEFAYDDFLMGVDGVDPLSSPINTYAKLGDTRAKGQEWSLFYSQGGFSLRSTLAKNDTVADNILQNWVAWEALRRPVWSSMTFGPDNEDWTQAVDPDSSQTLKALYDSMITANSLAFIEASEGAAVQSLPRWRANVNMRYAFQSGALRGFTAGLAARWRDSAAIGYRSKLINEGTPDELETSDLSQPINGPESLIFDAFVSYRARNGFFGLGRDAINVTYQLNVRNILSDDTLVPIKASSDGVSRVFRYGEPRVFSFSVKTAF